MTSVLEKITEYQNHLFHGSPVLDMKVLEPKQTVDDGDKDHEFNNDTAVFATDNIALAIIYSLIDFTKLPAPNFGGWLADVNPKIPSEWQDAIEQSAGYVYVLPKEIFTQTDGVQWKSNTPVKPVDSLKVTLNDFYDAGGSVEWMN